MKYAIFYRLKGQAQKTHQRLIKTIGPKFGENFVVEHPIPSHITLKYTFQTTQIKKTEKAIKDFLKTQKPQKFRITGFGYFNRPKYDVIYLKVVFSKQIQKIRLGLVERVKSEKGIKDLHPRKFDKDPRPHITIVNRIHKKNFNKIWNYLKTQKKPHFNLNFDAIALMKKPKDYWLLYKEFKIK